MEIQIEQVGEDCTILSISGEVDTYAAKDLKDAIRTRARPRLILDLSGVCFGSSSFLSLLIECRNDARQKYGRLVLLKPSDFCSRTLQTMRMTAGFAIANEREAALELARQAH